MFSPPRAKPVQHRQYKRRRFPRPRLCEPNDIASAVCFLASSEAKYITGQCLTVDGGRSVNGGSARFASSDAGMVEASGGEH